MKTRNSICDGVGGALGRGSFRPNIESPPHARGDPGTNIEIHSYVDRMTVSDRIYKDGQRVERRLQIYISTLREPYENGELTTSGWIVGSKNPADVLAKQCVGTATIICTLLTTNKVQLNPCRCV